MKPLFSFAGSGVKVDVTAADLAAVPPAERSQTILMRKVDYAPAIQTTDGNFSKVEVRVMFVWRDGEALPGHDPRPPLPGQDDGRQLQQGPDVGRIVRLSLAGIDSPHGPWPSHPARGWGLTRSCRRSARRDGRGLPRARREARPRGRDQGPATRHWPEDAGGARTASSARPRPSPRCRIRTSSRSTTSDPPTASPMPSWSCSQARRCASASTTARCQPAARPRSAREIALGLAAAHEKASSTAT